MLNSLRIRRYETAIAVSPGEAVALSERFHSTVEGALSRFQRSFVPYLLVEHHRHTGERERSGGMVLSERLQLTVEGLLVPFQCLSIFSLHLEHPSLAKDSIQNRRVILPKHFSFFQGLFEQLHRPVILSLTAVYHSGGVDNAQSGGMIRPNGLLSVEGLF